MRCFQVRRLSGVAMRCLGEVAGITTLDDGTTPLPEVPKKLLGSLFVKVIQMLGKMVPHNAICRLVATGYETVLLFPRYVLLSLCS